VTATIGLVVGAYSSVHSGSVSSHWYSLPTGCAPIAMLAQYVPSYVLQLVFIGAFIAYALITRPGAKAVAYVLPFAVLAGTTVVTEVLKIPLPFDNDVVHSFATAFAVLFISLIASGTSMKIGKHKIN
jgi:peptidoglycan/LPS O-acetylase OafA/YrhL